MGDAGSSLGRHLSDEIKKKDAAPEVEADKASVEPEVKARAKAKVKAKVKAAGDGSSPAEAIIERVQNDLRVTVQVIPPNGNGEHVSVDMLKKALADKKIEYGIDEKALERIAVEHLYLKTITVAVGDEPEDGVDAQLIYHYDKAIKRQDRSIDNLSQIDYKELGNIANTDSDVLLLERIPPTDGKTGKTVLGKDIRQVKGKDLRIRTGKGVRSDDDALKWYSEIAGQVVFRNDQVSVENVLEVENVDAETGNIHFKGTVIVKGIVEDNFVIDSTVDIRVMGSVGAAKLTAKGDIAVVGGIFGKGLAEIRSTEGSVYAHFSQDAKVFAAKDITIGEYVRSSTLRAGRTIHVVSKNVSRGRILGGNASATDEIHANNIGGEMEIATSVMVGVSKEDIDRIAELEAAGRQQVENLDNLCKSVFFIQREKARSGGRLDKGRQEICQRLLATLAQIQKDAHANMAELSALYRSVYIHKKGYLHVGNQIFPNVEINIQLATMVVRKPIKYASLSNNEGQVHIMPFMDHDNVDAETDKTDEG